MHWNGSVKVKLNCLNLINYWGNFFFAISYKKNWSSFQMNTVFEHWLHISASLSLDTESSRTFQVKTFICQEFLWHPVLFHISTKKKVSWRRAFLLQTSNIPRTVFFGVVSVSRTLPWASESEVPRQHLHWFVEDLFWRVFRALNTIGDLKFLPLSYAFLAAHAFPIHRTCRGHVVVWGGTNCKFVHRQLGRGQPWVTENIL